MAILDKIDKTVCLLLDKRIGRKEEISRSFAEIGLHVDFFIVGDGKSPLKYDLIDDNTFPPWYPDSIQYPTWFNRPNAYSAWKSHRAIFQRALNEGIGYLLLLEDDVFIEDDFHEILENADEFFLDREADMIYLGSYNREGTWSPTENENVIRVQGNAGFHGVILSREILQELVQFRPIGPMDYITGTYLQEEYECYSIFPSILSQKSGFSHIENSKLDKPSRFAR